MLEEAVGNHKRRIVKPRCWFRFLGSALGVLVLLLPAARAADDHATSAANTAAWEARSPAREAAALSRMSPFAVTSRSPS